MSEEPKLLNLFPPDELAAFFTKKGLKIQSGEQDKEGEADERMVRAMLVKLAYLPVFKPLIKVADNRGTSAENLLVTILYSLEEFLQNQRTN